MPRVEWLRSCGAPVLLLAALAAGCGKKGPPLAPLYPVPAPVAEITASRADDRIRLRFALPSQNQNGPGIDLDRVEIYAVTVPAGGEPPPNRELLTKPYLAGTIPVEPPAVEGAPEPAKEDTRPSPGETVTFFEQLTPSVLTPPPSKTAKLAVARSATGPTAPAATGADQPEAPVYVVPLNPQAGWPGAAPGIAQPVRIYVIRGVARNGRSGPPSGRVLVPLGSLPDAPGGVIARNTEAGLVVEWLPGVATVGGRPLRYNTYAADAPDAPLNPNPIDATTFQHAGAPQGTEICFRVRTVDTTGSVQLESGFSSPVCVTPKDEFPPAAPKGLAPVATPGAVQLIWDPNTEADLAGYLVLRAESPDETLQPLTPAPIRDTVYRDADVKPGVRYVYAIVAVDSATPPNRSAPSERAEAVAR
jgi:hypothetical protein